MLDATTGVETLARVSQERFFSFCWSQVLVDELWTQETYRFLMFFCGICTDYDFTLNFCSLHVV